MMRYVVCCCSLFGTTGYCSACSKMIPSFEMVMRAKDNVYHLECFACQQCSHRYAVLMPNRPTHRRLRRDSTVQLSRVVVGGVYCIRSSRRPPTNSVDYLETEHVENLSCHIVSAVWSILMIFFNSDVIMSSLVTNLSSLTAQEIVNCLAHDCWRVHSHRWHDSTRQLSRVGGVYSASQLQ